MLIIYNIAKYFVKQNLQMFYPEYTYNIDKSIYILYYKRKYTFFINFLFFYGGLILDDSIWPLLLLQVVLIALNAVFAAAEIAIVSMNDNKMAKMAKEGNKKAKRLVKLTSQPSRFLATIQIAITLAGFLGAASAAESFSDVIVEAVLKTGIGIPENILNSIVVFLITLIISFLNIVFGELVPKRIAMRNPESYALGVSGLIYAISKIFKPIVWLLTASTNVVLRLFKIDPNANDEEVSEEDIRMMVDVGSENGTIDRTEKEFIQNVFEFDDLTAGEVAVHRTEVSLLWLEESPEEWDKTIHGSRHKIYPVCNETVDNVVGILNAKDYFRLGTKDRETVMKKAVHPAYFVPEINDLVEQLVGDFDYDDSNEPRPIESIESLDSKTWKITGNPAVDDIEEALDISLKTEECDTFSGIVFEAIGSIPDDGCDPFEVETDGLSIKVLKVKNHQVQTAIVCKINPKKEAPEENSDSEEQNETDNN